MRMPNEGEDLIGKVCAGSTGRAGVVTGREILPNIRENAIEMWVGIGFDGKGTWASTEPVILAESAHEFYLRLQHRFGGHLSYLG